MVASPFMVAENEANGASLAANWKLEESLYRAQGEGRRTICVGNDAKDGGSPELHRGRVAFDQSNQCPSDELTVCPPALRLHEKVP